MKFRTWLGVLALLWLAGCSDVPKVGLEVGGILKGLGDAPVYLDKFLPTGNRLVDSTRTDDAGNFTLWTGDSLTGVYVVRLSNGQTQTVLADGAPVRIVSEGAQILSAAVEGNPGTKMLQAFVKQRVALRGKYSSEIRKLNMLNKEQNPESWVYQEARSDAAAEDYRSYVMSFIDTVKVPALADYAAVYLSPKGDFYYLQQYVEQQQALGRKSEALTYLYEQITSEGDPYLRIQPSDFKVQTLGGDSVSLHSLRGKVVYFYVWASYCGLSRSENQRLAQWYSARHDQGIEILSVSIDVDDRLWKSAIAADSLRWPNQAMGTMEWNSPEISEFGVESIPSSFLLDSKGIIRSIGIRGNELMRDHDKIVARWGQP